MAVMGLWWAWLIAALGLAILEMLVPSFLALGFAISAAIIGAGLGLGVLPVDGFGALLALFAGLAVLAWIALRWAFRLPGSKPKTFDHDIND